MPSLADKRATAEFSCTACNGPFYSQGLETYRVPMALYELNRARLVEAMVSKLGKTDTGIVLFQGGKQTTRYDTDHEPVFRQESYFHWAFGVSEADIYGAISLPSGNATLFVPQRGIDFEIFCGKDPSCDMVQEKYGLEEVLPLEQLAEYVNSQLENPEAKLHLLSGLNTDSGNMAMPARYDGIDKHASKMDIESLFSCIAELRVFKTKAEVDVMRYTNWVSSMAHAEVMRACRVGMVEYQLESLFQHHTYTHGGCRHMSYTCICACGPNPAVLHYGHAGAPNNRLLKEGDLALLDMGAEYHCYASDITCSFPVNGEFSSDQRRVYEAVLDAQVAVIACMKPGTTWTDMHRTAERAVLKGLIRTGLLVGDVEDMLAADLGGIFMPHGLGHLIGIDTHDVGGYAIGTPPRPDKPGLNKLRTARVLKEGMVLTVEPGCYFIDPLLDMAMWNPDQNKFINSERLNDFRGFGGIRLEDDVLVKADGCENLTICPRAVEEVVDVMKGGAWPPQRDMMPELRRSWVERGNGKMVRLDVAE
eukprot:CAMPEP_0178907954 /NCGR_PEP_ID=MMETSP0786-20121207/7653_1 /TAXON_ID=186022 /ORGANISM="Thalassionema frauenfeldii, Strain CCMP 1798" /LENGTH=533 /DNA_ID=CAMNT_0020579801 /DNA_START=59 /DNA_END=1660 /DNA_ORIENTATION=+